jgi:flavin-binding protein dodecin
MLPDQDPDKRAPGRVGGLPKNPLSHEETQLSESDTYKIVEVAGTSPDGVTEAMRSGVKRAAATLRQVDWVEVRSIRGHVEGDEIAHFQVEMRIGFKLEQP